jgi:hypothetical protein
MSATKATNRPNTLWPVGTVVTFVDAWGANPLRGRVIRHYGTVEALIESAGEIRHFCQTWRITSEPPASDLDFEEMLS